MDRHLFYPHEIKFLSIGVAMKHYHCFKIFIPSTGRVHISDTVRWFPHGSIKPSIPFKDELLHRSIDDLRTTIQSSVKNNILPHEGTTSKKTLLDLNDIFNHCNLRYPPNKPPTPTDVPRVIVQSNDPTIVPRVKIH